MTSFFVPDWRGVNGSFLVSSVCKEFTNLTKFRISGSYALMFLIHKRRKKGPFMPALSSAWIFMTYLEALGNEKKKSLNGNTDTGLNIVTWTSTSMKQYQDVTDHTSKSEMQTVSDNQWQLTECQEKSNGKLENQNFRLINLFLTGKDVKNVWDLYSNIWKRKKM